jgi:drug/metabolite transporter (DMT)-like permease
MKLFLLTFLTMIAFAANSVLNRMAVADGLISAELFAFVRVLSGTVVLTLLLKGQGILGRPSIIGVVGLAAYLIGFSQAYVGLDAGLGALILFGMVQLTMFTGAWRQAESVPPNRWIGMLVAFGGLVYVLLQGVPAQGVAQIGILYMVLAGIGWGIYSLIGQRVVDPLAATARSFLWTVPLVGLSTIGASFQFELQGVALAVLSGAVTSGLGYALWYAILPTLGAGRAAVAQLSVPVLAIVGGAIFLAEVPAAEFAIGTVIVLIGIAISVRSK